MRLSGQGVSMRRSLAAPIAGMAILWGMLLVGPVSVWLAATTFAAPSFGSVVSHSRVRPSAANNHGPGSHNTDPKICFWADTSGATPFGKSGFCNLDPHAVVDAPCTCQTKSGAMAGKVMFSPQADGSTQVVR